MNFDGTVRDLVADSFLSLCVLVAHSANFFFSMVKLCERRTILQIHHFRADGHYFRFSTWKLEIVPLTVTVVSNEYDTSCGSWEFSACTGACLSPLAGGS